MLYSTYPDRPILISGGKDAYLRFWNIENDYELVRSIPAHNFAIYSIVFSPDGRYCATASRDKMVKVWDSQSFELLKRIDKKSCDGHINSVNKALWTAYNNYLITISDDRSLIIWQVSGE